MRLLQGRPSLRGLRAARVAFALATLGLSTGARAQQPAQPPARAGEPAPPVRVPPRLLSDPSLPYPEGATGDATVLLTLVVNADGTVRSAEPAVVNEPFSSHAARGAMRFTFEPGTIDGKPVAGKIRLAIVYRAPPPEPEPAAAAPEGSAPAGSASAPAPAPPKPEEVIVVGDKPEPGRTATLTRAEVRQIPGTFGDPFRAVEIMPGVTPIVSGLPFFFIRGAPPGNVGYYLDGVRVPLLFHVGAGPSVVHPGLIERVDLYPGGYPARYGRFAGGIVAGEAMPPVAELHGEGNLRIFDAGALVEAPFAGGRGTALLGGRYSYTGAILTRLSPGIVLDYWDYQARIGYDLSADDRVTVFSFGAYDYLGQKTQGETLTLFGTEFHRVDLRYDHRLGDDGKLRFATTLGLDRSRLQEGRYTRDRLLSTRVELTQKLGPAALLRAGADAQFDTYDVELNEAEAGPSASRIASFFPTRSDIALGTRADVVLGVTRDLEVTPGARVDFFGSQGATAVAFDPRLAMRLSLTDRLRMLSAFGVAHQPPAFVIPVPGFQPGGLRGGLQSSLQQSLGLEADLDRTTTGTVTVFRNGFFNMSDPLGSAEPTVNGCKPGDFPAGTLGGDRGSQPSGNGSACGEPRFTPGTIGPDRSGGGGQGSDSRGASRAANVFEVRSMGSSYGLEIFVKKRLTSRLGGFLSYTLSRSTRSVGRRQFIATFDRTHVVNVALAFNLGWNVRAGGRVTFYTGLPAADPDGGESTGRLPSFFRLDVRLEKRWQLGQKAWMSVVAEWMNATLNKEAVATRCTLKGCEAQLVGPVTIPSLGLEGGF